MKRVIGILATLAAGCALGTTLPFADAHPEEECVCECVCSDPEPFVMFAPIPEPEPIVMLASPPPPAPMRQENVAKVEKALAAIEKAEQVQPIE